ncbi:MAG: ATP-binding cassette domain-containing protein [Proteobacteria bacterium]|nr:MAG: ATP-binding cassette domain-containing protein [Pseudomonadota bacterium]
MSIAFSIPTSAGDQIFNIEVGTSLYFVGANGGGKTRLAVMIEQQLGEQAHRISAHRALVLNPGVAKISEESARRGLKFGYQDVQAKLGHREGQRWGNKAAVNLLNDYDFLIQVLFAEQANTALATHKNVRAGNGKTAQQTKFEKLVEIWKRILPHRILEVSGDDIQVRAKGADPYPASDMSDGERATFYLIGQTLTAAPDSLMIFDEPELHLHRAIMSRLWDELEAARPDCAMVVISHDLEFVASRHGQKYVLKDYHPPNWVVEEVPDDTGFAEDIVTLILGSRKPVLFVEGGKASLDKAIFRACYPNWTVIPRGSCEEVIHAVVTMRANAQLTRVSCAGIVDADDYTPSEIAYLSTKGIAALPVSEIENLLLLPDILETIARIEGYRGAALKSLRDGLLSELYAHASETKNRRECVLRYGRRRIDRTLKKIDLSKSADAAALALDYTAKTSALDVTAIVQAAESAIDGAVSAQDVATLLKWYDNKGLLSIACKAKGCTQDKFEQWIVRALRNGSAPTLSKALRKHLPKIKAQ